MKRLVTLVVAVGTLALAPAALAKGELEVSVVSSPAQYVSGNDARVEVAVPDDTGLSDVVVTLNGADVTTAFGPDSEGGSQLEGVVTGLPLGESTIVARSHPNAKGKKHYDELTLVNNPIQGPIFSGPHQTPFLCSSAGNAGGMGLPPIPQSPTCETPTVVSFVYVNAANQFLPYDPAAPPPAGSIRQTTTMDGKTVPMILRWERGVINRFMYSIMMLSPQTQNAATPDLSAWNGKALFSFSGGVAIGHYQGAASGGDMRHAAGLSMGYAVLYSSGNRTNTHYNLQLGGETAIMVKDRFVSAYAEPEYTIGVGGSGGAIQQYVYGQNHPGLLDGGVPQYSYPDMVTQTIHVGDCELLEHWMDKRAASNPVSMWRTWVNRTLIEGLNASATRPNAVRSPSRVGAPGASERLDRVHQRLARPLAARAQPALVLAPARCRARPATTRPFTGRVEWTHWGDLVNIYGTDEHGFARTPWANVGVQYGLDALADGAITPDQFLDLNANVGSWKPSHEMVQEGCPYIPAACANPANFDVWSSRNMNLSPDGGVTPAARREGNQRGGLCGLPLRDGLPGQARHPGDRLAPLPRGRARHAQLAPVVRGAAAAPELRRRRVEPADLVHRRAAGEGVRPDAAGVPRPRPLDQEHPGEPGQERRREQADRRQGRLLRHERDAARERRRRLERDPRRRRRRRLYAARSRSTRRPGSSPAARSRAASSSARSSRWSARSPMACTARGSRRPTRSPG